MASIVFSPARPSDRLTTVREDAPEYLVRLVSALPPWRPGLMPGGAREYLELYGLDMSEAFPDCVHGLGAFESGDHHLALHTWELSDARETLYLVHGYFDHVGLYRHLVRYGLEQGYNVVAFDLPGHGLSSGPRAEILDFAEYRRAIVDVLAATSELTGPRHVIAQSTGGAAVMDFLQLEEPTFDKVVLLAPLVWPQGWGRINFIYLLLHRFVDSVPRAFADSSQDPEFLDFVREDPLQSQVIPVCWVGALRRWIRAFSSRPPCPRPLLILQGDDDGTVDWRRNLKQLERSFPAAHVETLATARHHLVNEHAPIREAFLHKITRFLRPGTAST